MLLQFEKIEMAGKDRPSKQIIKSRKRLISRMRIDKYRFNKKQNKN